MGLTPAQLRAAIVRNFPEKTGHDLAWWVDLLKEKGPAGKRERLVWLRDEHGLSQLYARVVVSEAERSEGYAEPTPEELVEAQYGGSKAVFRPVYDRLVKWAVDELSGTRISPCKTYVSFFRRRQYGVIAVKRDGVRLGLALPGVEPGGRLEEVKNLGCVRISHQIRLAEAGDVDDGVFTWLRRAYEADV
ncbi:DUF4287 domain-containing protein [bacterium]|nr:DUF4287 domain-containing protein [bacterium]